MDDWQPVGADDWQPVAKPQAEPNVVGGFQGEMAGVMPQATLDQLPQPSKGFLSRLGGDIGDVFMEGLHTTIKAPQQVYGEGDHATWAEVAPKITDQLVASGMSREEAGRETERLVKRYSHQEGMANLVMGPLTMLASPAFGAYRTLVSRPVEEATGFPKEATEGLTMVGLGFAGLRAMRPTTRVHVDPQGNVTADAIGTLPAEHDFKASAEVLGGKGTEQRLRQLWEERGIHPAEAVNDAAADGFLRHELRTGPINGPEPGYVRFYHGGDNPHEGGGRWVTTDPVYARDFRSNGRPNNVHYVDIPIGDPTEVAARAWDEIDVAGGTNMVGRYNHIEVPEHWAKKMRLDMSDERIARIATGMEEGDIPLRPAGADVTREPPPIVPYSDTPPPPTGSLIAAGKGAMDQIFGLGRNLQFILDPMATGSDRAMVVTKDAINSVRRVQWEMRRQIDHIERTFDREQYKRMWDAADEESVARQLGESTEHQGLVTLEPRERLMVEVLHEDAQNAWLHAVDAGMVEGEGLPAYTPRMVVNVANVGDSMSPRALNELGRNVFTRTAQMRHRKHMVAEETEAAARETVRKRMEADGKSAEEIAAALEKVTIARDIRTLPIATARLKEAVIWHRMIRQIEEMGKATGEDLVAEYNPGKGWFTIAGHPSFQKWAPKFQRNEETGAISVVKDANGNPVFEAKPLYMPNEFKGPMKAILDRPPEQLDPNAASVYGALMAVKARAMLAILNSPLIHNMVVWGKVVEAAGMREYFGFGLYSRGNKIVNENTVRARELIERGLAPMGHRGSFQDISSMMEAPNLEPGRGVLAKALGFIPGLFDPKAEVAVRSAIDKAGDFWHNTLLWDRVRDVQFGLADFLSDHMVAKGADRLTSDRFATHFANIIVGSIPKEAMSQGAAALANLLLFSRSFTLGNLSTFKQAATGLPKPILAQIERDFGMSIDAALGPEASADAAKLASGMARRKALSTVALSVGLFYVGNALLEHAFNVLSRDQTLDDQRQGYIRRWREFMADVGHNPMDLMEILGRLSPTYDHEPQRQNRVHIGYDKDGTAIYGRNPTGKFGEEMEAWLGHPGRTLRSKLSPMAGGLLDAWMNDNGMGRHVYDEKNGSAIQIGAAVGKHLVMKHLPEQQITGALDLLKGEGDPTTNKLRLIGPMAGFTASVGAPGGMARGEVMENKAELDARFNLAWPDIRRQFQRGDIDGGFKALEDLRVPKSWWKGLMLSATTPSSRLTGRTLRDFYQTATPQQIQRFERLRGTMPP